VHTTLGPVTPPPGSRGHAGRYGGPLADKEGRGCQRGAASYRRRRDVRHKKKPLTTADECERWLSAPLVDALNLQQPLPADALRMVALVEKVDELTPSLAAQ
jgi:hypothetical protein